MTSGLLNVIGPIEAKASLTVLMEESIELGFVQASQMSWGGIAVEQSQGGCAKGITEESLLLILREDHMKKLLMG